MASAVVITINGATAVIPSASAGSQGPPGPAVAPGTAGQFYVTNAAATAPEWKALSGDATGSAVTTGQLTVVKINGATVPAAGALTTGNGLYVSGASALTYSALNLAGGANYVTGVLPIANQANQNLGGALSGTTAAAVIVPGTAGQIYVSNATPLAGWTSLIQYETTHGRFTSGGGGTDYKVTIGPRVSNETTQGAVYVLPNATAASATNMALYSDGTSFTAINTVGTEVDFVSGAASVFGSIKLVTGNQYAFWFGTGAAFSSSNYVLLGDAATFSGVNYPSGGFFGVIDHNATYVAQFNATNISFGGAAGTAAPLRVDYTTATTPLLQSGTSATSFTAGTAKTGAAFNLQSGNAITALSLSNPGSGSLVKAATLGQHFANQVSKGANYTIDSSGAGDEQIWMTAACTITLPNPASASGRIIEIIINYDPAVGGGTIARNGAENINGAAANITLVTGDKFTVLHVRCNGTDWVIGKSTAAP